jgi:membrane protein
MRQTPPIGYFGVNSSTGGVGKRLIAASETPGFRRSVSRRARVSPALGHNGCVNTSSRLRPVDIGRVIRQSLISWFNDDAPSMGAAIAFYTLFAIAPILLIVIWAAGKFIGPDIVQEHILGQMRVLLGDTGADAVRDLLLSAKYSGRSGLSTALGIAAVVVGATSVFAELQNALHRIWRTPPRTIVQGLWHVLRVRLLSFGLVFGVGFLLLVSLVASAGFEGLGSWLGEFIVQWHGLVLTLDVLMGLSIATFLFAMIYKFVPREEIAWGDVWVGAFVTAALFTAGKLVIVVYLGKVALTSAYGVAGSFLVLLLWVYYSAQIFLLGAEFTRNFAYEHGSRTGRAEDLREVR